MYNSKNQKIRGWKRRINHIDIWFKNSLEPNIDQFLNKGEDYIKIRIDPWNRLCERVPPNWYFKIILEKILVIFDHWNVKFASLTHPFDLQIWLYDPNYNRSEIVCAKMVVEGQKKEDYFRASNVIKKFPIEQWKSKSYNLEKFEWKLFDDEDFRFKNLEQLNKDEISELIKSGFNREIIVIDGKDEERFSKFQGHIWVGRLIN